MTDKPEQPVIDNKPAKRKSDRLFYAVSIGTVLYGVLIFMLYENVLNPGEYLEYHKWNALGDTLAGLFAPLAFVWLVTAVIIQREELKSSRQQFDKSQEVINKQLAYIEDQSKKAEASALRDYKLALFNPRIEIYKQLIALQYDKELKTGDLVNAWFAIDGLRQRSQFLFGPDVKEWLSSIISSINALLRAVEFKANHESDDDGNFGEDDYFDNEAALAKEIEVHSIRLYTGLTEGAVSKNLMPYLKVYDENSA